MKTYGDDGTAAVAQEAHQEVLLSRLCLFLFRLLLRSLLGRLWLLSSQRSIRSSYAVPYFSFSSASSFAQKKKQTKEASFGLYRSPHSTPSRSLLFISKEGVITNQQMDRVRKAPLCTRYGAAAKFCQRLGSGEAGGGNSLQQGLSSHATAEAAWWQLFTSYLPVFLPMYGSSGIC